MTLRKYIQKLDDDGRLVCITEQVSTRYQIAAMLKHLEPRPVIFENVIESEFRVMGNLFCGKGDFADYLGISVEEIGK